MTSVASHVVRPRLSRIQDRNRYVLHGSEATQFHHWGTYTSAIQARDAALDILFGPEWNINDEPLLAISKINPSETVPNTYIMDPIGVITQLDEAEFHFFKGYDIEDNYDDIMDFIDEFAEDM